MTIPVLGVPVLNRPDLLYRMVESIDHPVSRLTVIDNGDVVSRYELGHPDSLRLIRPGYNLGVAASWNLIMRASPRAPWWLIVNSDLTFAPGDLARLASVVDPRKPAIYHLMEFAAFALTSVVLERTGYFDENFHPAYDEDVDFARRCELAGIERVRVTSGVMHVGSATIYSDPELRKRNGKTHPANDRYYERKWGGHKQGGEMFTTPFGRGGHLGEWRLEPQRLKDQSWS